MSWIFKDGNNPNPPDPKAARSRAMLLSLPFALLGFVVLVMFVHDELIGGMPRQKAITTLSFIAACVGFVALIFGINAKKMALQATGAKPSAPEDPEKPWLKRADWAAGRVGSSSRGTVVLLWIFTIFWCGISAVLTFAMVPKEWQRGNHAALIALVFPVIGLILLVYAGKTTLAWRRYGQAFFEMAAIPGALGGTLEGMIQVNHRLRPEHGLLLRLSCVRRTTTGSGKSRSTTEKILWQDEKWLRPDLPQTDANAIGIPVYFKVPADQPESTPAKGDGIHWRLEASARVRGPNFQATFEPPVFKLPDTPAPGEDTTAPYQMPLDEVRKQIHSRILVNELPDNSREFIFPAARNPGFAAGLTAFWLIWTGAIVFMVWKHAPPLFPLVFGAFDLLLTLFACDLWFRRSRVVATPDALTVQTSWLVVKRERKIAAADILSISAQPGATAGHQAYFDLKIHVRDTGDFAARKAKFMQTGERPPQKFSVSDPSGITVANNIAHKAEADWLVRQMNDGLRQR
jgi:hypothetical protein